MPIEKPPISFSAGQHSAAKLPTTMPRLHFIDGLRGLAMLMVLCFHSAVNSDGWTVPGHLFGFVSFGYVGVNLFLVLSGFCLYWPFVQMRGRREPTLWEFAKKRCRRILPPYYAALLFFWAFLLLDVLTHHHYHEDATSLRHVVLSLFWHLSMLYNLSPAYILSINGVFWSLGLEFSLYILFPLLVEAFRRLGPWLPAMLVLTADLLWRHAVAGMLGPQATLYQRFVLCDSLPGRCFEFAAGMTAAWIITRRGTAPAVSLLFTGLFLVSGAAAVWVTEHFGGDSTFPDALWGLSFASLVVAAVRPEGLLHRALSAPLLVKLGVFSYSVYLIHLPLTKALDSLVMRHHLPPVLMGLGVIVPLMLGVGYLFHLLFERPFMTTRPAATRPVPAGEVSAPAV